MTYHIQYKFLIINVSAINILCEITFFFLALQYDVHIVLKIHIQQCIRHLYGSENIQGQIARTGRANNIILSDVLSPIFAPPPRKFFPITTYTRKQIQFQLVIDQRRGGEIMLIVNLEFTTPLFSWSVHNCFCHALQKMIHFIYSCLHSGQIESEPKYFLIKSNMLSLNKNISYGI